MVDITQVAVVAAIKTFQVLVAMEVLAVVEMVHVAEQQGLELLILSVAVVDLMPLEQTVLLVVQVLLL
jgi:hypothetical protein